MSTTNVKKFFDKCEEDSKLREKVRDAKKTPRATTLNNIVAVATAAGFPFTPAEYENVVQSELETIFANHRAIFHHHLINI